MKQIIYILLTTTMLGLMSCSDWLDVSPKTSIPTDKQFESESGFKDALTGIYLKLGTTTLYAGDLTYAYLDELAGLYSDYPGYNTNAVFDQSIVFDYENIFLSKKNGIYSTMYNIIANINNFLEYVDKNKDVLVTERYYEKAPILCVTPKRLLFSNQSSNGRNSSSDSFGNRINSFCFINNSFVFI